MDFLVVNDGDEVRVLFGELLHFWTSELAI
jgi:hypothetical protein